MPTYTVADAMNLLLDPSTEGHEPPTHLIVEGGDQPNEMKVTFVPMGRRHTVHFDRAEVFVAAFRRDEMTAEPFADRDRWYPMLAVAKEVHPDATELAGEHWRTWIGNVIGIDEHDCLAEESGPDVLILVGRRTCLPTRHGEYWSVAIVAEPFDVAIQIGETDGFSLTGSAKPTGFLSPEELRDAWLDAVAVAASRNQRAEEQR